jgi:hypothetical protein
MPPEPPLRKRANSASQSRVQAAIRDAPGLRRILQARVSRRVDRTASPSRLELANRMRIAQVPGSQVIAHCSAESIGTDRLGCDGWGISSTPGSDFKG